MQIDEPLAEAFAANELGIPTAAWKLWLKVAEQVPVAARQPILHMKQAAGWIVNNKPHRALRA